jgi:hypothetical protein
MTDSIIDNRRSIRPRVDETALHKSALISEDTVTTDIIKLDIVAGKITMFIPSTLTVSAYGSIDGVNFFILESSATNGYFTYGDSLTDHLVKTVKLTWEDGSGSVIVAATQKSWGWPPSAGWRAKHTDRVYIRETVTTDFWKEKNLVDSISAVETVTKGGPTYQSLTDNVSVTGSRIPIITPILSSISETPTIYDTLTAVIA